MSKFQDKSYQAFRILQATFVIIPIIAGLDKFFYLLTNWAQYLSPAVLTIIHYHSHKFMLAVGVIEMIAGLGVYFKPKIFAYVIALWLLGIIMNLILTQHFYDIALRDFGLMLSVIALGKLAQKYDA